MKAMNPSLSKRYTSAAQILKDLEEFQNEQQFKLNIPREEGIVVQEEPQDLDATRKLNNTGEVAALMENERREPPERRETEEPRQGEEEEAPVEEQKEKQKKHRSPVSAALIFSVVAVVVFCVGAFCFVQKILDPFGGTDSSKINAPNLKGLYYSQVIADPQYSNVVIAEGEYVYNETVDAGKIISQEPEANRKIDPGATITVTISRGNRTFALPNYVNSDARQAKIELDRFGVQCVEAAPEYNDEIENGFVIRTDPAAGTMLTEGDTVTITVSRGPEFVMVDMPDLMGKPLNTALELLDVAGGLRRQLPNSHNSAGQRSGCPGRAGLYRGRRRAGSGDLSEHRPGHPGGKGDPRQLPAEQGAGAAAGAGDRGLCIYGDAEPVGQPH